MSSREPKIKRLYHAAASVGQKLYVWGGSDYSGREHVRTMTVESFDVSSESWFRSRRLRGKLPDGLQGVAITQVDENAYTFGGEAWTGSEFVYFNKLFEINLSTLQCREIVPEPHSHVPKQLSFSGMVHFNHMLVVHGGCCRYGQERTDDVYVFDLRTRVWSVQPTTGEKPPPLSHHTFMKIDHHRAVVVAGITGWKHCNDTYLLDMHTWHWSKPKISGEKPPPRYSHATCYIAGPLTGQQYPLLMVVGGHSEQGELGDVWLLDVDKWLWSEVTLPVSITPRESHSASVFGCGPRFRMVVLFGGCNHHSESLAETTLLLLEIKPRPQFQSASCQVTRVVRPDELGKPDERLREQTKQLEIFPQEAAKVALMKAQDKQPHPQRQVDTAACVTEEEESGSKPRPPSESQTEDVAAVAGKEDADTHLRRSLRNRRRKNRFEDDLIAYYKPSYRKKHRKT